MTYPAKRRIDRRGAIGAAIAVLAFGLLAACAPATEAPAVAAPAPFAAIPAPVAGPDAYALAEQALADGRLGDAKTLLHRAVLASGDTPRARLIAAELQLAGGAYRRAAEAFESLVADQDVGPAALQGQGIALILTEEDALAGVASLRMAVAQDPALWRAWNALGYYYDRQRDWRHAGDSYNNALAANPASAMILNNRGFSFMMQGRVAEAVANLNEALRRDPSLRPAHENLRLALAWDGQYAQALAGAEDGGLGRALNNVGYIAMLRGDHDKAEAYLLQAIEADPAYNSVAARNLDYLRQLRQRMHKEGLIPPQ